MSDQRTDESTSDSKFPAIVILIVLILAIFLLLRGCDNKPVNEAIKSINGVDQASLDQAAAEKAATEAAAKKAAEEKAAAEAMEIAAAEKAAAEATAKRAAAEKAAAEAAAKKAAEEKAAAEAAAKKAAEEKAAAEAAAKKAAEEKAAAEAAAKKAAEEKAAAEAAAKAAADKAADNLPSAGFTYSADRAAEVAAMQKENMTSIEQAQADAATAAVEKAAAEEAARKAAAEKAAAEVAAKEAAEKAAAEETVSKASAQAISGFTYSDERAMDMNAALANLRDEKPEMSMAAKSKEVLNAFGQAVGEFFGYKLPNGQEVMIPKGGFEESMLNALGSEAGASGNTYILDRIFFTSGSSALDKQSSDQVATIANILKAYPDNRILLRGHTDSTGSASVNMKLSKARADAVMKALAAEGIDASRLSTKGVGPSDPVESNDSEEGRRMNRRIDISVM